MNIGKDENNKETKCKVIELKESKNMVTEYNIESLHFRWNLSMYLYKCITWG